MAEGSPKKKTTVEDFIFVLIALFLVSQVFENVPRLLNEKFGIELNTGPYLIASAALTEETSLGTEVGAPNGATFFSGPGKTELEGGTVLPGTPLILIEGPVTIEEKRWWRVRDIEGRSGWVEESVLIRSGVGGLGPTTELGSKVRTIMDTNVFKDPDGLTKTGSLKKGELAEITKGPKSVHGSRWWHIDVRGDLNDGWVAEVALLLTSDSAWREGAQVEARRETEVLEKAGRGIVMGSLRENEKAKVLGGPIDFEGEFWWLVHGTTAEGWVKEEDLRDGGVKGLMRGVVLFGVILGTLVTLGLLAGIIYVTIRTNQILAKEKVRIGSAIPQVLEKKRNERWDRILLHVNSDNPSDWRLAIIEADVLLDEVLTRMGYTGDTLGEKLKQVVRGDLHSIDGAWEAHKVRNQIAHAGGDYILTQREARRVIDLYASVFAEVKVI